MADLFAAPIGGFLGGEAAPVIIGWQNSGKRVGNTQSRLDGGPHIAPVEPDGRIIRTLVGDIRTGPRLRSTVGAYAADRLALVKSDAALHPLPVHHFKQTTAFLGMATGVRGLCMAIRSSDVRRKQRVSQVRASLGQLEYQLLLRLGAGQGADGQKLARTYRETLRDRAAFEHGDIPGRPVHPRWDTTVRV